MKKILICILISTSSLLSNGQKKLPKLENVKLINESFVIDTNRDYTLVVISAVDCGYANKALIQLKEMEYIENLNIIVCEFGDLQEIKRTHSSYFNNFAFIHGNKFDKYSDKFFPVFMLYKKNKRIWKKKGLSSKVIEKIRVKTNCLNKN